MSLDGALKVVQIAFYVTGATAAVLTYRSARKGLLNTVNTEYYKRVIDKLDAINSELMSEFDPASDNYWAKKSSIDKTAKKIVAQCKGSIAYILSEGFDPEQTGFPGCYDEDRMTRLLTNFRSDPFIPATLREHLVQFLDGRREAVHLANLNATIFALRQVIKLRAKIDWDHFEPAIHNHINKELYSNGFGISQVEEKTSEFRAMMQSFFSGFDPTRKSRLPEVLPYLRRASNWGREQINITLGRA